MSLLYFTTNHPPRCCCFWRAMSYAFSLFRPSFLPPPPFLLNKDLLGVFIIILWSCYSCFSSLPLLLLITSGGIHGAAQQLFSGALVSSDCTQLLHTNDDVEHDTALNPLVCSSSGAPEWSTVLGLLQMIIILSPIMSSSSFVVVLVVVVFFFLRRPFMSLI